MSAASQPARSRLGELCGGLMEACWLAAVVLVPLAYNPHGVAGFQPFKMAFVRLLAAVLAAAWLVRIIEGPRVPRVPGSRPTALWIGVVLFGLMQVLSAARAHADRARATAPAEFHEALEALRAQLQRR